MGFFVFYFITDLLNISIHIAKIIFLILIFLCVAISIETGKILLPDSKLPCKRINGSNNYFTDFILWVFNCWRNILYFLYYKQFWALWTRGGGGADSTLPPPHRIFFIVNANQMKLCTIVNWYKLYILVV